jgi:hypothetical protein
MKEYMTVDQIRKKYRSEWVLLTNPKTNLKLEVLGGHVLFHSKDRDTMTEKPSRFNQNPLPRCTPVEPFLKGWQSSYEFFHSTRMMNSFIRGLRLPVDKINPFLDLR